MSAYLLAFSGLIKLFMRSDFFEKPKRNRINGMIVTNIISNNVYAH